MAYGNQTPADCRWVPWRPMRVIGKGNMEGRGRGVSRRILRQFIRLAPERLNQEICRRHVTSPGLGREGAPDSLFIRHTEEHVMSVALAGSLDWPRPMTTPPAPRRHLARGRHLRGACSPAARNRI